MGCISFVICGDIKKISGDFFSCSLFKRLAGRGLFLMLQKKSFFIKAFFIGYYPIVNFFAAFCFFIIYVPSF